MWACANHCRWNCYVTRGTYMDFFFFWKSSITKFTVGMERRSRHPTKPPGGHLPPIELSPAHHVWVLHLLFYCFSGTVLLTPVRGRWTSWVTSVHVRVFSKACALVCLIQTFFCQCGQAQDGQRCLSSKEERFDFRLQSTWRNAAETTSKECEKEWQGQ